MGKVNPFPDRCNSKLYLNLHVRLRGIDHNFGDLLQYWLLGPLPEARPGRSGHGRSKNRIRQTKQ